MPKASTKRLYLIPILSKALDVLEPNDVVIIDAGASHMNAALPTSYFRKFGLISLLEEVQWFTTLRQQRSL